ncbi:MAG: hypothetical protein WCR08_05535 [Gammaproteobacteria bacterium]
MYCKLEVGSRNYVSYDRVNTSELSKIVEIKFEDLKGNQFEEAVRKVDWNTLTKLKKIHGINSAFDSYRFPRNSLPKLEEIEFTRCNLNSETLTSLLNAVPDIDSKENFIFKWDPYSSFMYADFLEGSEDELELAAFELASKRIQRIQNEQKKHERNSGETTVPDEDREEETYWETGEHEQFKTNRRDLSSSYYDLVDSDTNSVISSKSGRSDSSTLFGFLVESEMSDELLHQTEFDENEEIEITYTTNGSANPIMVSPSTFNSMSLAEKSRITEIEINANGMPLLSGVSFDDCTNLASLTISDAIIDGTYLVAPSLPKLTSLNLYSCGVNVEGVGYFLSNGTSRPDIQMRNIAKEDGSTFVDSYDEDEAKLGTLLGEQKEILEFQQALQTRYKHISHISASASTEPLFTTEYAGEEYTDDSSQTSNDEYLSGYAVASSRKKPTANSHALDELFRRNLDPDKASRLGMSDAASSEGRIKNSRVHPVSVDDSMSDDSLEVSTKPKKSSTYGKTKSTMSDSTLSEMDVRDRGKTTVGHRVEVASWDGADETPLVEPKIVCLLADGSVKVYRDLTDSKQRQAIVEMVITGVGPNTNALVLLSQERWNELTQLKTLRISDASITTKDIASRPTISLPSLTTLQIGNCGIDFKGLDCLVGASNKLSTVQDQGALQKAKFSGKSYSWEQFLDNDPELAQIKSQFRLVEQSIDQEEDMLADIADLIRHSTHTSTIGGFGLRREQPNRRGMDVSPSLSDHDNEEEYTSADHDEVGIKCWLNSAYLEQSGWDYDSLPPSKRINITHMRIKGEFFAHDVMQDVAWDELSNLKELSIKESTVTEIAQSAHVDRVLLPSVTKMTIENCCIDAAAVQSLYEASSDGLEEIIVVEPRDSTGNLLDENEQYEFEGLPHSVHVSFTRRSNEVEEDEDFSVGDGFSPLRSPLVEISLSSPQPFSRRMQTDQPEILCYFGDGKSPTLYSDLRPEQLKHIRAVVYDGLGQDEDAMTRVKWAEMRGLWKIDISNALVESDTPFEGNGEGILFPELGGMSFSKCRLGSSAVRGFVENASEDLLTKLDISSDCEIAVGAESQAIAQIKSWVDHRSLEDDFSRSHGNDGGRPHTMRATGGRNSLHKDPLRMYSPGSNRSDSRTSRRGNELGDDEEFLEDVDLPLPQSPQLSTRSETAEIICYFDTSVKKLYSELNEEDEGHVTAIDYIGTGPEDNAMATVDWEKLTGLQSVNIRNASVLNHRHSLGDVKLSKLEEINFTNCCIGLSAIKVFVNEFSPRLGKFNTRGCFANLSAEIPSIEQLQSNVNSRSFDLDVGYLQEHDELFEGMYSPGSNSSDSSTPRIPRRATTHSQYEAPIRTQTASRVPSGPGAAATRTSLFTPYHAPYGTTGGLPSVRTDGASARNFQNLYKRSIEPELVVDNESPNSRDFQTLVHDTQKAFETTTQESTLATGDYVWYENERDQTARIEYRHANGRMTPILDASIDTVKVHRGWKKVDRTISHETRAQIVLASLGIPPCPPDIAISNERSGLGRAIRAEFTKLQRDEPEIIVSRTNH